MNRRKQGRLFDLPGRYRIRVQGWLSANHSSRLSNMVITTMQPPRQRPITTLIGEVQDQAALMGVLNALYDMGLPLLRVERIGQRPSLRPQTTEPSRSQHGIHRSVSRKDEVGK